MRGGAESKENMAWADWPDSYWTSALTWEDYDIERLPRLRSGSDHPSLPSLRPNSSDRGHWTEDLCERGEVVRPKVEERPGTHGVQECGVRMPQLGSRQLQQRQSRERGPDHALLGKPAGGLKPRTQERIRCTANQQPSFLGVTEQ